MLLEFKHLIAASDSNLGQKKIVKHRIDTCDARQMKQQPLRTPIGLRKKEDQHINDMLVREIVEP